MIKCSKAFGEIIERRKRYFTPSEMETVNVAHGKLILLEEMEEQGRLVILPCKIGDTIYEIDLPEYGVIVCNVLCFTYGRSNITGELTWSVAVNVIGGHGLGSCYTFDQDDFGKTVFINREEAEAALKGEREQADCSRI